MSKPITAEKSKINAIPDNPRQLSSNRSILCDKVLLCTAPLNSIVPASWKIQVLYILLPDKIKTGQQVVISWVSYFFLALDCLSVFKHQSDLINK